MKKLLSVFLAALMYIVLAVPKTRSGLAAPAAFIVAIMLIEAFYLFHYLSYNFLKK